MESVMACDDRFSKVLLDYIETKACMHAADDDVYIKFLEKQALHHNTIAEKELQSTLLVTQIRSAIDAEIDNLSIAGLHKLHTICTLVKNQVSPHFVVHRKWTTCNISSLTTSECVVVGANSEWCVDISYLPFLEMLWTVTNMDNIEFSKFTHFITERPVHEKIIESLRQIPQNKEYNPDSHVATYMRAFRTVLATLRSTLHAHSRAK
jgi:hypothetical protein